ncbi:MAG: hypothetical protein QOF28_381, partial [Actinomycetota bacterium]|nr:hypothetical protein [Actinomycetota bacterium]
MSRRGGAAVFTVVLAFGLVVPAALAKRAGASPGDIYVTTTVDELNTGGACSLREAIRSVNLAQAIGGCQSGATTNMIWLPAGTFRLTRVGAQEQQSVLGDLDITRSVYILGAGADKTIIDGNATDRVFDVFNPTGDVTLEDLAIQNGKPAAGERGGGIEAFAGGRVFLYRSVVRNNQTADGPDRTPDGGGIYNDGTMIIQNSTVNNNLAGGNEGSGGGIWNSGTITVNGSFVRNNTAHGGNAAMFSIDGGGGIFNRGTMTVAFDAVTDNISKYRGGGIANSGRTDITKSLFSGNTAVTGGGLFTNGTMPVTNTTISGNAATVH